MNQRVSRAGWRHMPLFLPLDLTEIALFCHILLKTLSPLGNRQLNLLSAGLSGP